MTIEKEGYLVRCSTCFMEYSAPTKADAVKFGREFRGRIRAEIIKKLDELSEKVEGWRVEGDELMREVPINQMIDGFQQIISELKEKP